MSTSGVTKLTAWSAAHWACGLFGLLLTLHLVLVAHNVDQGYLVGHEFRQTQTALSIVFMDRETESPLAYPTPVYGPPWSIPLEFPLYQWAATWLVKVTNWSIPTSGRLVSILCFYLTLPGLFLILGEAGIRRHSRWLVLSLVLSSPVYIFYTRAVLIESTALMFSIWFLFACVRLTRRPGAGWWLVVVTMGSAAALVKATTLLPWALAATGVMSHWCWRGLRTRPTRDVRALGWSAASAVPMFVAMAWWTRFSDSIKQQSPGGSTLLSGNVRDFALGTFQDRLNSPLLHSLAKNLTEIVVPWWILVPVLAIGVLSLRDGRARWFAPIGLLAFTLFTFPVLYARHDYYFYAVGLLPLISLGAILGELSGRFSRAWLSPVLLGVVLVAQADNYRRHYFTDHNSPKNGGTALDNFIRDMGPPDDVLIIAGQDWLPATPYYARHRALMLRYPVSTIPDQLDQYLDPLEGEPIAGLLVSGSERENTAMIKTVTERFNLSSIPAIVTLEASLFLPRTTIDQTLQRLVDFPYYEGVRIADAFVRPSEAEPLIADFNIHALSRAQQQDQFSVVSPVPYQYRTRFGAIAINYLDERVLLAHATTDFWVRVNPSVSTVDYSFAVQREAYANLDNTTDGVSCIITALFADGSSRLLVDHFLDPAHRESDRAIQTHQLLLPAGTTELIFSTVPQGSPNFDWTYWRYITVH